MRNNRRGSTFYCFSPPVMIATFIIEISLAVYTLWRYKMNAVARLAALILTCLALFQLAEYQVCEGLPGTALTWSRIGYVAIALLPPLGLHLLFAVTNQKRRVQTIAAYAAAAAFAGYFLLAPNTFDGHACLGNYVIFQVARHAGALFGAYYYGLLTVVLWQGWRLQAGLTPKKRQAVRGLMLGYLAFIVPTVAVDIISPDTVRGIPSVMCGFAVLLALTLVFTVLPATVPKK